MKPIDTSKPVRFVDPDKRDWEVEMLSTDMGGHRPLLFRYRPPGNEVWHVINADRAGCGGSYRIENATIRHGRWVNFYPHNAAYWYGSREHADKCAGDTRIACVYVEFDEGEGL